MLAKIKKDLRFIDGLPLVIDAQAKLLEQWCKENGWRDFEVTSNLQFRAIPPDGSTHVLVPVEAFSNIKNQEISSLVSKINVSQQTYTHSAVEALAMNVLCLGIVILGKPMKEAISQAEFATSIYWLINVTNTLVVIIAVTFTIKSLIKKWEVRKLKNDLSELLNQQEKPKVAQANSWIESHAGVFKDDPLWEEFIEAMATHRRELDAEVNAWLDEADKQDTGDLSN